MTPQAFCQMPFFLLYYNYLVCFLGDLGASDCSFRMKLTTVSPPLELPRRPVAGQATTLRPSGSEHPPSAGRAVLVSRHGRRDLKICPFTHQVLRILFLTPLRRSKDLK